MIFINANFDKFLACKRFHVHVLTQVLSCDVRQEFKTFEVVEYLRIILLSAQGTFLNGIVLCCHSEDDDSLLAVKCIDVDDCPTSYLLLLQQEVSLMRKIQHPNISLYSSVWLSKSRLCMSSPLMGFGSCADIISSHFHHGIPEEVIALIMFEILKALSYLHRMNLVHRGLRCSHILISKDGEIKLCGHRNMIELMRDGVPVKKVHEFPNHDSSMLPWLSPEILQQDMLGYGTKSDIYSLGITACELANGHAPFTDMSSTQMLLEKLNGTIPFMLDETTIGPLVSDDGLIGYAKRDDTVKVAESRRFSDAMHQLVTGCLERDPDARMDASQLLKTPFFKQFNGCSNLQILQPVIQKIQLICRNVPGTEAVEFNDSANCFSPCSVRGFREQEDLLNRLSQMTIDHVDWDFGAS